MPSHTFRQHVQVRFVQWAHLVVAWQQLRQHSLHPFGSLRSIFCATGVWTATTFIAMGSLCLSIIHWFLTKNITNKMKINHCYIWISGYEFHKLCRFFNYIHNFPLKRFAFMRQRSWHTPPRPLPHM